MLPHCGEIRGAQLLTGYLHARRLHNAQRGFDAPLRLVEISEVTLDAREVGQRRRLAASITHLLPEMQSLIVAVERLSPLSRRGVKQSQSVEREGFPTRVFGFLEEIERLVVIVERFLFFVLGGT